MNRVPIIADKKSEGSNDGDNFFFTCPENKPGEIVLLEFGHHQTYAGYSIGPSERDRYTIHFVCRGSGTFVLEGVTYHIQAPAAFLIRPNQIYRYAADTQDPWEYYWFILRGEGLEDALNHMGFEKNGVVLNIFEPERLFDIFRGLCEEGTGLAESNTNMFRIYADMYNVFGILSEGYHITKLTHKTPDTQTGNEYTRLILQIIDKNYGQRISVSEIAYQLNLNRSYMTELFKRDMGISIKQYLTNYRLDRVKVLLLMGHHTIKEIAAECGFDDPLYLSRQFKKHFGVSPNEWREKNVNG